MLRSPGRFNCRVAQAGGGVQDGAYHGGNGGNFLQRILPWISVYDAVHSEARDQHARYALCRQEAADAIGMLGEDLDGFYAFIFDHKAIGVGFFDFRDILPAQSFPSGKSHARGGEHGCNGRPT